MTRKLEGICIVAAVVVLGGSVLVVGCSTGKSKNDEVQEPGTDGKRCRPNEYSKIPPLQPETDAEKFCATDRDCVITMEMNGSCCSMGCGLGTPMTRAYLSRLREHQQNCCEGAKFTCKQYSCPEAEHRAVARCEDRRCVLVEEPIQEKPGTI